MKHEKVVEAIDEAKRFLRRAEAWEERCKDNPYYHPSKESGALRRASLDLTRALAEMRKYR